MGDQLDGPSHGHGAVRAKGKGLVGANCQHVVRVQGEARHPRRRVRLRSRIRHGSRVRALAVAAFRQPRLGHEYHLPGTHRHLMRDSLTMTWTVGYIPILTLPASRGSALAPAESA